MRVPWTARSSNHSILKEISPGCKIKFLDGPVVKSPSASAGHLGSIPGSGRTSGEGHGNPLQYSCLENPMDRGAWQATVHGVTRVGQDLASKLLLTTDTRDSLLAQSVKNLPAMPETWVQFLGQEEPLEKEMATHSSILAWRIVWIL